nr:hypothetical protein [uncultured Gellertiella sp.]
MSSDFYAKCMSRNLVRISGAAYRDAQISPAEAVPGNSGLAKPYPERVLRDYVGLSPVLAAGGTKGAFRVTPLEIHWMGS